MKTLNLTLAALVLSGLGSSAVLAQSQPMAGDKMGAMSAPAPMADDKMGTSPMKSTGKKSTHKKATKSAMATKSGDAMSPMGH